MTPAPPQSVLITGGAARIGAAMARDMAAAGWAVAIHYNSSSGPADDLVSEIEKAGGKAVALQADLTDDRAVRGLISAAREALGPLGMLVNNASIFLPDQAGDERALWDAHLDIHLRAPSLLSAAFFDQVADDSAGVIVNIIDQRVWRLTPKFHSYTLSKAAMWTMTQTLAQAYAPKVRVNAIGPGPTLANERQDEEDFQQQVNAVPLQRGPQLFDFAKTLLYFADMASVTGQMIALDGGQHLAWETPDQAGNE